MDLSCGQRLWMRLASFQPVVAEFTHIGVIVAYALARELRFARHSRLHILLIIFLYVCVADCASDRRQQQPIFDRLFIQQ